MTQKMEHEAPIRIPEAEGIRIPASSPPGAPDITAMPEPPRHAIIELGASLKPRPEKARTRRIGIVPAAPAAPVLGDIPVQNADGFTFPANVGETDTTVVNHGGTVAPGVPVQLIFWGSTW